MKKVHIARLLVALAVFLVVLAAILGFVSLTSVHATTQRPPHATPTPCIKEHQASLFAAMLIPDWNCKPTPTPTPKPKPTPKPHTPTPTPVVPGMPNTGSDPNGL